MIVAVDPSISSCGVAIFDDGELVATHHVRCNAKGSPLFRARSMARELVDCICLPGLDGTLVAEWPQLYGPGKSKGNQNGLLLIPAVLGCLTYYFYSSEIHVYTPQEWCGQIPKLTKGDVKSSVRAKRILKRLIPEELTVWDSIETHDEIDAVGIGLHHMDRGIKCGIAPIE